MGSVPEQDRIENQNGQDGESYDGTDEEEDYSEEEEDSEYEENFNYNYPYLDNEDFDHECPYFDEEEEDDDTDGDYDGEDGESYDGTDEDEDEEECSSSEHDDDDHCNHKNVEQDVIDEIDVEEVQHVGQYVPANQHVADAGKQIGGFSFKFPQVKKSEDSQQQYVSKDGEDDCELVSTDDNSEEEKQEYEKLTPFDFQLYRWDQGRSTFPSFKSGFLNKKQKPKKSKPQTSYSGLGVGSKDYVPQRTKVNTHTRTHKSTENDDKQIPVEDKDTKQKPEKPKKRRKRARQADVGHSPEVASVPQAYFEQRRAQFEEQRRKLGLTEDNVDEGMMLVQDKRGKPQLCAMRASCTVDCPTKSCKGARLFFGQQWLQINCSEGCTVCYHYKQCWKTALSGCISAQQVEKWDKLDAEQKDYFQQSYENFGRNSAPDQRKPFLCVTDGCLGTIETAQILRANPETGNIKTVRDMMFDNYCYKDKWTNDNTKARSPECNQQTTKWRANQHTKKKIEDKPSEHDSSKDIKAVLPEKDKEVENKEVENVDVKDKIEQQQQKVEVEEQEVVGKLGEDAFVPDDQMLTKLTPAKQDERDTDRQSGQKIKQKKKKEKKDLKGKKKSLNISQFAKFKFNQTLEDVPEEEQLIQEDPGCSSQHIQPHQNTVDVDQAFPDLLGSQQALQEIGKKQYVMNMLDELSLRGEQSNVLWLEIPSENFSYAVNDVAEFLANYGQVQDAIIMQKVRSIVVKYPSTFLARNAMLHIQHNKIFHRVKFLDKLPDMNHRFTADIISDQGFYLPINQRTNLRQKHQYSHKYKQQQQQQQQEQLLYQQYRRDLKQIQQDELLARQLQDHEVVQAGGEDPGLPPLTTWAGPRPISQIIDDNTTDNNVASNSQHQNNYQGHHVNRNKKDDTNSTSYHQNKKHNVDKHNKNQNKNQKNKNSNSNKIRNMDRYGNNSDNVGGRGNNDSNFDLKNILNDNIYTNIKQKNQKDVSIPPLINLDSVGSSSSSSTTTSSSTGKNIYANFHNNIHNSDFSKIQIQNNKIQNPCKQQTKLRKFQPSYASQSKTHNTNFKQNNQQYQFQNNQNDELFQQMMQGLICRGGGDSSQGDKASDFTYTTPGYGVPDFQSTVGVSTPRTMQSIDTTEFNLDEFLKPPKF